MRPWKKSRTDSTAHGIAPTWIGTCSACATSRAPASQIAVEKSRLELRICEYAVRSMASPISCTMDSKRWVRTLTVIGSAMALTLPRRLRLRRPVANKDQGKGAGAEMHYRPPGFRALRISPRASFGDQLTYRWYEFDRHLHSCVGDRLVCGLVF